MRVRSLLLRALPHSEKHQQARGGDGGVLLGFASLAPEVGLTQSARVEEAHRWVGVYGEARRVHCCDSHPCCDRGALTTNWAALTPSEQRTQSSRFTPSCPSVVL
jgi:hypothetical protein